MQEVKKKRKKRFRLPNGLGSVHKIGDSKSRRKPWRARVPSHVEVDEVKGTAKQKYITIGYYETEVEAIEALMEYRKNPYTLEAAEATFLDVVNAWEKKKFPTVSVASRKAYQSAKKNTEPIHGMKMRTIRTEHLEELMEQVGGSYALQSRLKTYLGMIFKYAMERDIIQKNYAEFAKSKVKDEGTKRTDIPAEDRAKIWAAAKAGDRIAKIVLIYIYTGFRASELLEVRKENVDLEARIMIGGLKTDAGKDRHVPIHKCIMPFIEELMNTEGEYLVMWEGKNGRYIKASYKNFLTHGWGPLADRLGFTDYTLHYCRHSCATMMREANIAEDIRKLILGHASGDITDRYTHISDAMLVEAIDLLPSNI